MASKSTAKADQAASTAAVAATAEAPKLTRRQREEARAQAAREAAEAERKAFREGMPARMLALMAMANPVAYRVQMLGMKTREDVQAGDIEGLTLRIHMTGGRDDETDLTLDTESWEFESVISRVQMAIDERAAAEEKLRLARETYDGLSPAQRDALGLKHRP